MKSLKTPLRYPGGKSRAAQKIEAYFPDLGEYDEFREPFIGGGSVAIYITKKFPHLDIWVNDRYEPLVNFWQQLQKFGEDMHYTLLDIKRQNNDPNLARDIFLKCKEQVSDNDIPPFNRAVAFYVVNKCSFSGLTESSSFSRQASISNFSVRGIEKLPGFQDIISNWNITNYSYENMLEQKNEDKNVFYYLDPPYDIKDNLYGKSGSMHKGFDHDKFAFDCCKYKENMAVSYNSNQLIKDRFKDWTAVEFDLTYTMRSVGEYMREQKDRKELLLLNYNNDEMIAA